MNPSPTFFEASAANWQCQRLEALAPRALHRILQARQEVFVLEQDCAYLDADSADDASWHLAAWAPDLRVMAYARVVDPGVKYAEASIGRVLTARQARGTGMGRELVRRAIEHAKLAYPGVGLRISAQSRLEGFYGDFGFTVVGVPYLEDNILHTEMLLATA
jgi:ElaA protein